MLLAQHCLAPLFMSSRAGRPGGAPLVPRWAPQATRATVAGAGAAPCSVGCCRWQPRLLSPMTTDLALNKRLAHNKS